ncbi:MAG: hypothetical protein KBE25_00875 [Laribacter sp.]|nr:hypothetical protein [Laribacter sp.]MBP9607897.1 hypothetical protein [Laribacter sp.]
MMRPQMPAPLRLAILLLPFGLGACAGLNSSPAVPVIANTPVLQQPASQAASMQQAFLDEANAIADRVRAGKLTRLEAADALNRERLRLFGPNAIDDAVFTVYRQETAKLERGMTTQADLRRVLIGTIERARLRYNNLPAGKRPNAGFTRFLIHIYDQAPL